MISRRIEIKGIGHSYQRDHSEPVLTDIDLDVRQGDFIAIEGPSGSGKSTLLNIIGLLDLPIAGSYRLGGVDVESASPRELAELRSDSLAFIFQNFHLLDRRPAIDSVELGLMYRGATRAERRRASLEALAQVGLRHLAFRRANELSGGQRQRVAIARALASGAPIVIADEPTGNLDTANGDLVISNLLALNLKGATVVLVTHDPRVAASARLRLHLVDGRIVGKAETAAFTPPTFEPRRLLGRPSRVRVSDVLRDGLATLSSRKARSASLAAAVALGVALAVTTLGISSSANAQVSDAFDSHTNRDVTATLGADLIEQDSEPLRTLDRVSDIAGTSAVAVVDDLGPHYVSASDVRPTFQVTAFRASEELDRAARVEISWAPGRTQIGSNEALVGLSLAQQLRLGPLVGRPVIRVDGEEITVVGTISNSPRLPDLVGGVVVGTEGSLMAANTAQRRYLVLTHAGSAQSVARQIPFAINPFAPSSVEVLAPVDPTTLRSEVEGSIRGLLLAFTLLALVISVAALTNAMILGVAERKQEIGLRRALGARPSHVFALVTIESAMVGILGGIAGVFLGLGTILAVTIAQHWRPLFELWLAPGAVLAGMLIGSLGGVLASVRASRVQPSDALRI